MLAPANSNATTPSRRRKPRGFDMAATTPRSALDCKSSPVLHRERQPRFDDVAVDREDAKAHDIAAGLEGWQRERESARILGRHRNVAKIDLGAGFVRHRGRRVRRLEALVEPELDPRRRLDQNGPLSRDRLHENGVGESDGGPERQGRQPDRDEPPSHLSVPERPSPWAPPPPGSSAPERAS